MKKINFPKEAKPDLGSSLGRDKLEKLDLVNRKEIGFCISMRANTKV
jgi:hypothetical protein